MDIHALGRDIIHIFEYAPLLLALIHHGAHELARHINMRVGKRLFAVINISRVGVIRRVIHLHHCSVCQVNFIDNARNSGNQIEVIFPVEPFLNDFKVQQA